MASSKSAAVRAADSAPAAAAATVVRAAEPAPASGATQEPQSEQQSEPKSEPSYDLEIRLDSPALTGDSAYHVRWSESRIRALLSGSMTWVPVPVRAHLPGQAAPNAARFVYIQAISEIVIHHWPQD